MEGVQSLPPHQQNEFMRHLENMQMKDGLLFYNNLVSRCFDTCVTSFRSKQLDKNEATCVDNCATRYLKSMQRTTVRFQEHQANQNRKAAELATAGQS